MEVDGSQGRRLIADTGEVISSGGDQGSLTTSWVDRLSGKVKLMLQFSFSILVSTNSYNRGLDEWWLTRW